MVLRSGRAVHLVKFGHCRADLFQRVGKNALRVLRQLIGLERTSEISLAKPTAWRLSCRSWCRSDFLSFGPVEDEDVGEEEDECAGVGATKGSAIVVRSCDVVSTAALPRLSGSCNVMFSASNLRTRSCNASTCSIIEESSESESQAPPPPGACPRNSDSTPSPRRPPAPPLPAPCRQFISSSAPLDHPPYVGVFFTEPLPSMCFTSSV